MNLIELQQYTTDEERAEEYLRKQGIIRTYERCPHCESTRIGRVRRSKFKCYDCRREWGPRRGSILEGLRVPLARVLLAIKLFELDTSVRESASQLNLSYNTVYSLFNLFRQSIAGSDKDTTFILSGEIEMDESYFGGRRKGNRGRGAAGKIPVFGILERGGKVRVEVVRNVSGETLLEMAIKKVKRGSLIYTDKFRSYNGLVSYGFRHLRIDHGKRFVNGKVYINGIEGFWSFAKERLMKYHRINPVKFPLYLKELEFRYNNRHHDLYLYDIPAKTETCISCGLAEEPTTDYRIDGNYVVFDMSTAGEGLRLYNIGTKTTSTIVPCSGKCDYPTDLVGGAWYDISGNNVVYVSGVDYTDCDIVDSLFIYDIPAGTTHALHLHSSHDADVEGSLGGPNGGYPRISGNNVIFWQGYEDIYLIKL